jgi:hypothetical protein
MAQSQHQALCCQVGCDFDHSSLDLINDDLLAMPSSFSNYNEPTGLLAYDGFIRAW